jgi:replicative DNA helicase
VSDLVPPHDHDAERAVLGEILLDNAALVQAQAVVRTEDFHRDSHRRIYDAMTTLAAEGRALTSITVASELARSGDLDAVGGLPYISRLLDGVPGGANVVAHAGIRFSAL